MTTFFKALENSAFHVVGCTEALIGNIIGVQSLRLPSNCVVRIIRSQRCATPPALFQEFAAALQFPYYFGMNWHALDECLGDLEWLPAQFYILVITNADCLLSSARQDLETFCSILSNAVSELAQPTGYDPRPRPLARLHVIFQVEPSDLSLTMRSFQEAGLTATQSDNLLKFQSVTTDED